MQTSYAGVELAAGTSYSQFSGGDAMSDKRLYPASSFPRVIAERGLQSESKDLSRGNSARCSYSSLFFGACSSEKPATPSAPETVSGIPMLHRRERHRSRLHGSNRHGSRGGFSAAFQPDDGNHHARQRARGRSCPPRGSAYRDRRGAAPGSVPGCSRRSASFRPGTSRPPMPTTRWLSRPCSATRCCTTRSRSARRNSTR